MVNFIFHHKSAKLQVNRTRERIPLFIYRAEKRY